MELLPFVFGDKATVPGYYGIDVQKELNHHILNIQPDKILLVCDSGAQKHFPDYFSPLHERSLPQPEPSKSSRKRKTHNAGSAETAEVTGPKVEIRMLPEGDEAKSWDHLSSLMRWAFDVGATKKSVIVAFGGGALINVTGLFASILFRGSKVVYVPTTFLAMHDVVTSLKTSICYDGRKNNIGSFYAPVKILIDLCFLRTLPPKELFSGLGELAKNALILGGKHAEGFISALTKHKGNAQDAQSADNNFGLDEADLKTLVWLGVDAKMGLLATDAYEKTSGMIFEYGHTVSHAIEKAYGDGTIPHGLGVTYGMLSSSYAAERLGIMSAEDRQEHDELCWLLLKLWPLPEPKPTIERIMGFAMRDSKRGITSEADDEISDVILRKLGDVVSTPTNNLSKFPCKLTYKWLYSMGFPHDGCAQVKSEFLTFEECKELLDAVRTCSDKDLVATGFEPLTVGFANHVWGQVKCGQRVVVKRYTELAFIRFEAEALGTVDMLSGEHGVGPHVHYFSPQGSVIQRVDGQTLEESDMHKGDLKLLDSVAQAVAKLHQLSVPQACEGPPMLWRCIDRMLEAAGRTREFWPEKVPDIDVILDEVLKLRVAVDKQKTSLTLCHGDLKPSNVILNKESGEVRLIDHELGGPNYRAFDLMKIFRTAEKRSDQCMEHFFRTYLTSSGQPSEESDVQELLKEAKLFEPLTWFEAACFFLALPQFKPQETSRWHELALDRWEKYQATKVVLL
jgi:3-dehydroquinate synthase/2-deoxy-scyllo-inosose synthase